METLELSLVLLAAVLLSSVIDQIVPKLSSPLIQIALGVLIAIAAGSQIDINIDNELFLVLFIAPLLYDEARHADKAELLKNIKPVISLAIGLVIAIVLIVGFTLHWLVPSIPLTAAFALGAALGPTDAVAVASLPKDINIGTRQRNTLKGEYLINDASGIVSFQFAIAATVTGAFSLANATIDFVISFFGGIVFGVVLGLIANFLVRRVRDLGLENTTFHVLYDILTPFIVFLIAEAFHVSGIIAVVCAGLVVSVSKRAIGPSFSRMNIVSSSAWSVISFALNGIVFVLLGTQLPRAMQSSWDNVSINNFDLIRYIIVITAVLVLARFLWLLVLEYIHYRGLKKKGAIEHPFGKEELRNCIIMTLGGPKGAITLSIMLTIPIVMTNGAYFPQRDLLIFLASGVILCTLLLSNFAIPLFAPKRDVIKDELEMRERETSAMIGILRSVVEELTAHQTPDNRRATQSVVHQYNNRIENLKERSELDDDSDDTQLRLRVISWEKDFVLNLIHEKAVDEEIGYEYLDRLDRLARLLNHNENRLASLKIMFMRYRSKLHMAKNNVVDGVPFLSESDRTAALRSLQLKATKHVVERLQANISELGEPTEDVAALLQEYTIACAALRTDRTSFISITKSVNSTAEIQRRAYQIELDAIQQAYEDGTICRQSAKRLRDNVQIMKIDIEDQL